MLTAVLLSLSLFSPVQADAIWLITQEEAAKPAAPPGQRLIRRAMPAGPRIVVIRPKTDDVQHSPLAVSVRFEPRENVPVDLGSLKVVVQKLFDIDITDRVMPFASPEGIMIDDAKIPSGEHLVEISVADMEGRRSSEIVKLSVGKP
jgi:hypothetical protein